MAKTGIHPNLLLPSPPLVRRWGDTTLLRAPIALVFAGFLTTLGNPVSAQTTEVAVDPPSSEPAETPPAAPDKADVTAGSSADDHQGASDETKASILHADALEAELDGQRGRALELLRHANALSPRDEFIAYDLARVAYELKSPDLRKDTNPFLKLKKRSPDAYLLSAYLRLKRGQTKKAARDVNRALAMRPTDSEALALRDLIAPPKPKPNQQLVKAKVQLFGGYDTNPTVLADPDLAPLGPGGTPEESESGGGETVLKPTSSPMAGFSGAAILRPLRDATSLNVGVLAGLGWYPSDTSAGVDPANVNTANAGAVIQLAQALQNASISAQAVGMRVWLGELPYMDQGGLTLKARTTGGKSAFGAYVSGAWRNFNQDAESCKAGVRDDLCPSRRTGGQYRGGLEVLTRVSGINVRIALGAQAELAAGKNQKEWGPEANAGMAGRLGSLEYGVGVVYVMRDFWRSFDSVSGGGENPGLKRRVDHRITPKVNLGFMFTENVGLMARYSYTANRSGQTQSYRQRYQYDRHLGQMGLTARW